MQAAADPRAKPLFCAGDLLPYGRNFFVRLQQAVQENPRWPGDHKGIGQLQKRFLQCLVCKKIAGPRPCQTESFGKTADHDQIVIGRQKYGERESFTITERIELVDVDGKPVQGLEMSTDTVSVSVEVKRVKVVPIVISHTGSLPEGVTIVNERIEPNTIRVQGPDEIVQNLENIRTESIDYSEMNVSGERKVGLQFPEGVTEDETIEPVYTYNVRTPVDRDMIIGRSAIELRNPPEDTNARIGDGNPIVVRLSGEEEDLDALRENQIKLYLDLDGLQAGTHEVQVQMEPIPNLRFDPEAFPEIRVIIDEVTTENME
jgi:hypothetical protein